jgi:hypothetical protein
MSAFIYYPTPTPGVKGFSQKVEREDDGGTGSDENSTLCIVQHFQNRVGPNVAVIVNPDNPETSSLVST